MEVEESWFFYGDLVPPTIYRLKLVSYQPSPRHNVGELSSPSDVMGRFNALISMRISGIYRIIVPRWQTGGLKWCLAPEWRGKASYPPPLSS